MVPQKTPVVLAALVALLPLASQHASANDIAPFRTFFETDLVAAAVGGMRNVGSGEITLSGVSGTIRAAYLYWHGPTNSTDPNANAVVSVNGSRVTGKNIGFSGDNCWKYQNSQAYRADVTSLVAGTGNGKYALTGFGSGQVNTNGASLVVFFDDGDPSNNRDVVLFEGNDSNTRNTFDADGWTVTLEGIRYRQGTASIQLHVADGQYGAGFDDDSLILNGKTLAPRGPIFQGTSVPSANNGPAGNGSLWDIRSFQVESFLKSGLNTLRLTMGGQGECLSLVLAAVNLPAGGAPASRGWLEVLMDTTTLLATFGLLAFLVERLVNGVAIVFGYFEWWRSRMEVPATATPTVQARVDRNRRVALFGLSALLGVLGAYLIDLNLLAELRIQRVPLGAGKFVTGLLIASGADPIRELLKLRDKKREEPSPSQPIQVSGTLLLQQAPPAPAGRSEGQSETR